MSVPIQGNRFLVIGGAGFVGSHLVDQLLENGAEEVIVFDNMVRGKETNIASATKDPRTRLVKGTITDTQALEAAMDGVDGVFHLAALWLGECLDRPEDAVEVNIKGTFNVMEAARKLGIGRVVYSSSASVYGNAVEVPMTEEHPFNNRTFYGATKVAGEQMFRAYNDQHGLDYVGLRYMNVYGPRMDYKGTYVSVIMKVLDRIEEGQRPVIFGDGEQSYDFVHVSDVARCNILAMEKGKVDECYNVGMGTRTTINELVHSLLELTGSDLESEHKTEAQSFVTHRIGSTVKAEEHLGFRAEVQLADGLKSVVDWRLAQATA